MKMYRDEKTQGFQKMILYIEVFVEYFFPISKADIYAYNL